MHVLDQLLINNQDWAADIKAKDPTFFTKLSNLQTPEYFWIGCSDSRVPSNQITGTLPGEIFVHRNIANVVVHTDLNCLSVLQFAVDVLKVKQVIVCGHYGCGGIKSAFRGERHGLVDNWLRHIQDVYYKHEERFKKIKDEQEGTARLSELNVVEQVMNVCHTSIIKDAWARGQGVGVHGLIYGINDGLLHNLGISITGSDGVSEIYQGAVDAVFKKSNA